MVSVDDFYSEKSNSVDWVKLASAFFGGLILAVLSGFQRFILVSTRQATGLIDGLASFLNLSVFTLGMGLSSAVLEAFDGTVAFVESWGFAGWVVGIVAVLALLYIVTAVVGYA